ncbi:four-carbon acid sugar kinase family protein [Halopenitus sp. H-Gu1]|uniref:four-carbon acid sugar kinase family protein n=1 Tax=Halopenitus sp. H-Gu1 TaxID=3242697 RepID=UPI00359D8D62
MYAAAIVADDLTGSMDTSHGFAARGNRTAVLALPGDLEGTEHPDVDASVIGVNTDSRYVDRETAIDAVTDAVRRVPAEVVFKKIDSTLRGNVAVEVEAALSVAGSDLAVVAPAFPAGGRTTEGGIHRVDGTPVAETEYGDDEAGPTDSSIPAMFADGNRPVMTVGAAIVEDGVDAVHSAFQETIREAAEETDSEDHAPIVVCDARTDAELSTIADAAAAFDALYVGSGGLAEHVTVPGSSAETSEDYGVDGMDTTNDSEETAVRNDPDPETSANAPLGVVGSINSTTLGQLARVPDEAVFELDPVATVTGDGNDAIVTDAIERLRGGETTIITAAADPKTVDRTRAAGAENGLAESEVRRRVAAELGETATQITDEVAPSGVFLTGGDIAVAVLRAFEATTIRLTGRAVEAGIPIGRLVDGRAAGTLLVTKAGGFGDEATIVNCLSALAPTDE